MRTAAVLAAFAVTALLAPGLGSGRAPGGLVREAAAQPERDDAPGDPAERRGSADSRDRREQIKKKIRALRAYTLTEELSLDEQTAARLFPVLARYDDDFDRLLEQRMALHRMLDRVSVRAGNRDVRAIERLIDDAAANQRAFSDLQDKRLQTLRKILTARQTARLLVVLPAIERRIENQLRKAIQRRPGSTVDDDDDREPDETAGPRRPRRREAPLAPRGGRSNAPGNTLPCDPSAGPCR